MGKPVWGSMLFFFSSARCRRKRASSNVCVSRATYNALLLHHLVHLLHPCFVEAGARVAVADVGFDIKERAREPHIRRRVPVKHLEGGIGAEPPRRDPRQPRAQRLLRRRGQERDDALTLPVRHYIRQGTYQSGRRATQNTLPTSTDTWCATRRGVPKPPHYAMRLSTAVGSSPAASTTWRIMRWRSCAPLGE